MLCAAINGTYRAQYQNDSTSDSSARWRRPVVKVTHIKQTLLPTCIETTVVGDNKLTVNLQPAGKG